MSYFPPDDITDAEAGAFPSDVPTPDAGRSPPPERVRGDRDSYGHYFQPEISTPFTPPLPASITKEQEAKMNRRRHTNTASPSKRDEQDHNSSRSSRRSSGFVSSDASPTTTPAQAMVCPPNSTFTGKYVTVGGEERPVFEGSKGGMFNLTKTGIKSYLQEEQKASLRTGKGSGYVEDPPLYPNSTFQNLHYTTRDGKPHPVFRGPKGGMFYVNDGDERRYLTEEKVESLRSSGKTASASSGPFHFGSAAPLAAALKPGSFQFGAAPQAQQPSTALAEPVDAPPNSTFTGKYVTVGGEERPVFEGSKGGMFHLTKTGIKSYLTEEQKASLRTSAANSNTSARASSGPFAFGGVSNSRAGAFSSGNTFKDPASTFWENTAAAPVVKSEPLFGWGRSAIKEEPREDAGVPPPFGSVKGVGGGAGFSFGTANGFGNPNSRGW